MSFLTLPHNHWPTALAKTITDRQAMANLDHTIAAKYQQEEVLPDHEDIFNALKFTDYPDVKVVILGQDPYPDPRNAMGLAFSVKPGVRVPASLHNIYIERNHDLGLPLSNSGDLRPWTKEGVLLLNTFLTVKRGAPASHQGLGWEIFTDGVIKALNNTDQPIVYFLWGRKAQNKETLIAHTPNHLILKSSHPSPFSATKSFFGSYPFSKANHFLIEHGTTPINWNI